MSRSKLLEGAAMAITGRTLPQPRSAAALALLAAVLVSGGVAAETGRPPAKISEEQAVQAALKVLPGKITDISIEKKRGKSLYVVEVVSEKDGAETDVLVDPETGQVVGMDR